MKFSAGVHYYNTNESAIYESDLKHLYYFKAYVGYHKIVVEKGDSAFYFDKPLEYAGVAKGPCEIESFHVATIVRGYMHPNATFSLEGVTTLPYINGCSTKQIFPPIRLGDPSLQYLLMPMGSKEQEHHIHSTFRIVLILEGSGKSIVGIGDRTATHDLKKGMVCILEPMCPHHFEASNTENLVAAPFHVFSSIGTMERNHPMLNGTVII